MRLESQLEKEKPQSELGYCGYICVCICVCVIAVPVIVLVVYTGIYLAGTNHPEYFKACGRNLWDVIVASLSLTLVVFFIRCILKFIDQRGYKLDQNVIDKSLAGVTVVCHFIIGICLLVFYEDARNNPDCLKAMTAANSTNITAANSTFSAESSKGLADVGLAYGILYVFFTSIGIIYYFMNMCCSRPQL